MPHKFSRQNCASRQHFNWNDLQRLQPDFESRDYQFEKPNDNPANATTQQLTTAVNRKLSHEGLVLKAYVVPLADTNRLEPIDAFSSHANTHTASLPTVQSPPTADVAHGNDHG